MITKNYTLTPKQAHDMEQRYRIVRRSVDARQRRLKVNLTVLCDDRERPIAKDSPIPLYTPPVFQFVGDKSIPSPQGGRWRGASVSIVGAGPAGLFAALTLLEHGIKPIIYERGKEVSERKKDIALLNRGEGLNLESNYCFGEGGAGTFSDGKLFSRSKKRGNMQRVMELFHYFGAPDTVLYEAHAHIGSDKLPTIIRNMRECILEHGGEIHFNTRVDSIKELLTPPPSGGRGVCILAIGHSAHDTYRMLAREGVQLDNKGFALGVRIEHPQALINKLVYHNPDAETIRLVGNASYSLVTQVSLPSPIKGEPERTRGVYSFCMCPGGHMVPAGSGEQAGVVNGMSASHRNSPFANSGMVVEIRTEDGASLDMQEELERLCYEHAQSQPSPLGESRRGALPAQRVKDFVEGKESKTLPETSYLPGVVPSRLDQWLPREIGERLRKGIREFDRKYPGYMTNEAVVVGVESRSSSPVRITRDPETLESVSTPGLYPVGEGAGYAGGITSSAMDGINAAMKIITKYQLL